MDFSNTIKYIESYLYGQSSDTAKNFYEQNKKTIWLIIGFIILVYLLK